MKLYVTYILNGAYPGEQDRHRSRTINWHGVWKWTESNLAVVRRALSNANLKPSRIVVQSVRELEDKSKQSSSTGRKPSRTAGQ